MSGDSNDNNNSTCCHFGEHLTIDGYGGDFNRLNDKNRVLKCLHELPEKLGVKKLADPQVFFAPDNEYKDPGGWSGFVVIAESHISIHTFPNRGFLSADVYTCKNGLNIELIIDYFTNSFGLQKVETNLIKRGTCYPAQNIC